MDAMQASNGKYCFRKFYFAFAHVCAGPRGTVGRLAFMHQPNLHSPPTLSYGPTSPGGKGTCLPCAQRCSPMCQAVCQLGCVSPEGGALFLILTKGAHGPVVSVCTSWTLSVGPRRGHRPFSSLPCSALGPCS